jgi:peptidoglycan/LPS O-acetylase OafA/YrhL
MVVAAHGADVYGVAIGRSMQFVLAGGLSFFFVLSGFVLAYNYPCLDRPGARADFLVLRFARLWPSHVAALALFLAVVPRPGWLAAGVDPGLAAFLNAALLQAWVPIPGYASAFNGPTWTLSVDLFLYLIFPLLLAPFRAAPWRTWIACTAASVACAIAAGALPQPASASLTDWNAQMLARFFPPARLMEFATGMLAAKLFVEHGRRFPARTAGASALEIAAFAACALALAQLHRLLASALPLGVGVADWLGQVGAAPLLACLIVVLAHGRGAVARALSTRPAVHFGDLSYATYLLHIPVLHLVLAFALVPRLGAPAAAALSWFVLLVAAHAGWRLVERPARHAIVRAWMNRRRDRDASAACAD